MNHQIVASAIIIHEGKILIAKRSSSKGSFPNTWEIPGGRIEIGEQVQEGLVREVQEELGVDIKIGEPACVYSYTIDNQWWTEIDFIAKLVSPNQPIRLNPEDHSEYYWMSAEEVNQYFAQEDRNGKAIQLVLRRDL